MKNINLLFASLFILFPFTLKADDSIVVVKGQIGDYYIPVVKTRTLTGHILDETGMPLDGATVMLHASVVHATTDKNGYFEIVGGEADTLLNIYYPGKELKSHFVPFSQSKADIRLRPDHRTIPVRRTTQATHWYNPFSPKATTYCNPMNISYNYEPYNDNVHKDGSFRSSADPMMVEYKGEYFLFSTNQGGFHYSKDLIDWEFIPSSFQRRPTDDDQCAPAAYVNGDTLFYAGSTYRGLPIWYSTDPKSGRFKRYIERIELPSWDPAFLLDDDGRLYLYYGSSNEFAMKGVELDRRDFHPISKIHELMFLHPEKHGWERFGMNNDDEVTLRPFTEGAFVNKHNGKYYFQYGAPGTEFKVYADGVYVSDSPLGPFVYQKHNPMSYKPGGYVQGSGHGGTMKDLHGNYWHVSTCMLSLKYKFERRIGLYPAAFDADGVMYSSSAFGDYPNYGANRLFQKPEDTFTGWMLLSYRKPVTVSSTESGFDPKNIVDESMRSYWVAASSNDGEWVQIDLEKEKEVRAIQINYYDHHTFQYNRAMDIYHQYQIYHSLDGKNWQLVVDKCNADKDVPHDYVELEHPLQTRYLKMVNIHVPSGSFALSGFRVFGNAHDALPSPVKEFQVKRDRKDRRNALISWKRSEKAYGYNIYYGIAPDKLYNSITVLDDTSYDFRGLDVDTDYYFAIEALGESGRSSMTKIIKR